MITRKLWTSGNSTVMALPNHTLSELDLVPGQQVAIDRLTKTSVALWNANKARPPFLLWDRNKLTPTDICPLCGQLCGKKVNKS